MPTHALRRLRAAILLVFLSAGGAAAQGGVHLAPAPFQPPAVGTTYAFDRFVTTVTAVDGWRVDFRDPAGRPGSWVGVFLPDNPASRLALDDAALAKLWPLEVGNETVLETRRDPLRWRWTLRVVGTEVVTVPAGRFETYVVEGIEAPVIAASPTPATTLNTWWYAPSVNAVVRLMTMRQMPGHDPAVFRAQLERIDLPR